MRPLALDPTKLPIRAPTGLGSHHAGHALSRRAFMGSMASVAGAAMGIGAMTVAMLGLPLTSVLITSLFLQADAVTLMPLVIVAVVVSYVASARLVAATAPARAPAPEGSEVPTRRERARS